MKKMLFLICIFFTSIIIVNANTINSIDIDVYIDEFGNADVTEVWDVDGSDGTEWYKGYKNLGNIKLSDFVVSMDGKDLTYKNYWDINGTLSDKKGYYGINKTSDGLELCFGKYDYKRHMFKLNYKLSNFIFNTDDAQVIYFNFIDKMSNVNFENYSINIKSYYDFPETLDVWGYGHKGYTYVKDGIISMSNEGKMDGEYVVLLAKFPLNTFKTDNSYSQFETFNNVFKMAEEGTYDYNYTSFLDFIISVFNIFLIFSPFIIIVVLSMKKSYGYINNKVIKKDNTPFFRDIPCNKDIYYANALIRLNNPSMKKENILGAILLKWIKEKQIIVQNEKQLKLIFDRKNVNNITNQSEKRLYEMMYEASQDGILESHELKKWAKVHYNKYLNIFEKISSDEIYRLKAEGHIRKRKDRAECKYGNVLDDTIYNDYKQLYGLKLFLDEFSSIGNKEAIEVTLWEEYLMFAYLFGIADKVAKQFKNLYPEIVESPDYIDFNTVVFLNDLSSIAYRSASSARSAAQSYSSGGGGFSSGGGGGGSFGGGGGGGSR